MTAKNSSYRMSSLSKLLASQIHDAHERGDFLRQMAEAEQTYLRMRQRQPRNKDRDDTAEQT